MSKGAWSLALSLNAGSMPSCARLPENVYNSLDLVVFGVSWKNGKAKKQFDHYASQRPDVYGCCVRHLQDNLRRAVEPGLYVRVYFFVLLAR